MKIILKPMGAVTLLVVFAALAIVAMRGKNDIAADARRRTETPSSALLARAEASPIHPILAIPGDLTAQCLENPEFVGDGHSDTIPGWSRADLADKRMFITRDQNVFHTAPASVRLWTVPGAGRIAGRSASSLFKKLPVPPGHSFTVTVIVCKRGNWKQAEIVTQLLNKDWSSNKYVIVASFAGQKDGEWKTYSATVPVDSAASTGVIGIVGDGEGSLNLDDISIRANP